MKKVALLIVVIFLFGVLFLRQLPGVFYNNAGRLIWLKASEEKALTVEAAMPYFQRALESNPRYPQARISAALVNILMGNEEEAFAHWEAGGIDPSILVAYGNKEEKSGNYNDALLLYKDSAELGSREGYILAGNICQHVFYEPEQLSDDKLDLCKNYFSDNENNLIVNANFDSGDLIGWSKRYWSGFSGRYLVDREDENETFTAIIQGENDKEIGAVSQELTLPADTAVRFSARVKVDLQEGAEVRLLHIVWTRPDGESAGNQFATIDEDMEWEYVERTIQLPQAKRGSYAFSPAILSGRGNVWIDDVRLEIVSEN